MRGLGVSGIRSWVLDKFRRGPKPKSPWECETYNYHYEIDYGHKPVNEDGYTWGGMDCRTFHQGIKDGSRCNPNSKK